MRSSKKQLISGLFGGALLIGAGAASASTLTLNFSAPVPGTIKDVFGNGTGFTARLPGTGSSLAPNDSNLTLNTGDLSINSGPSDTDGNGDANPDVREAIGVNLSTLGFTGTQDFSVSATYTVITPAGFSNYDQFGAYIGNSAGAFSRAGSISTDNGISPLFSTLNDENPPDDGDGGTVFASFPAGTTSTSAMTVIISRTGGVYSETVNGADVTGSQASLTALFTTGQTDLNVGAFVLNVGNAYTADLTNFTVSVTPEPGSLALIGFGVAGMLARRRRSV